MKIGALLGDFVRGTPESLKGQFPDQVIEGIILHRKIDRATDHHPVFQEAKQWLSPERRRFSGIIIDIFFDHLLMQHWATFGVGNLQEYIEGLYRLLKRRADWLTPELQALVPRMREEDWLSSPRTTEGLALTFRRVSRRRQFLSPLVGAERDLEKHRSPFDEAFLRIYPDLIHALASA